MKIGLIDQKGEINNLPADFRLNIDLNRNSEGFHEISQEFFGDLHLYLGIIPENLELALIPISLDGISKEEGEKNILRISSNEVLKIPLIAFLPFLNLFCFFKGISLISLHEIEQQLLIIFLHESH